MKRTSPDIVDYHEHLTEAGMGLHHMQQVVEGVLERKEWNKEDGLPSRLLGQLKMAKDLLLNRKAPGEVSQEMKTPQMESSNFSNLARVYRRLLLVADAVVTQLEEALETKQYPGVTYAQRLATSPLNLRDNTDIQLEDVPDAVARDLVLGVRNNIAYLDARFIGDHALPERKPNATGQNALGYQIVNGKVVTNTKEPFVFDEQDLDLDKLWQGRIREGVGL